MCKKCWVCLCVFAFILSLSGGEPITTSSASIAVAYGTVNALPLIDHHLGADPFALTYNGRVYITFSTDDKEYNSNGTIKRNSFANLNKISVISSADMDWVTMTSCIPAAGADGLGTPKGIAKWAGASWAPSAAAKKINGNGKDKEFLVNGGGGGGKGVADSPILPWTDPIGKQKALPSTPLMSGVVWLFDPAVFVDDDGTGYSPILGGVPPISNALQGQWTPPKTGVVWLLGPDMTSVEGSASTPDAPFMFEDSGMHKYNGKYYYSGGINFGGSIPADKPPGEIGYMTSSSPMDSFSYRGHFLKNPGAFFGGGGNNHHAVFNFKNEPYVVYHTQTVSSLLYGAGKGYRSPHINKLVHNPDGSLQEVAANFAGVKGLSNLNPYHRVEAETFAWNGRWLTEASSAGGGPVNTFHVTNIQNEDWVAVGNAAFGSRGASVGKAFVAFASGGTIAVRLGSNTGRFVFALNVPSSGSNIRWTEITVAISGAAGVHNVFKVFTVTGTAATFVFDFWQFTDAVIGGR
nr:endo, 1-4, beta xylanase [uncultured bacterium]